MKYLDVKNTAKNNFVKFIFAEINVFFATDGAVRGGGYGIETFI